MKKQMAGVDSAAERAIFGRNLRHARIELRLRQRDIHVLTGIAQSHLSEIEAGTCNIAIDTMVKLATVVKMPLWRLFKPAAAAEDDEPEDGEPRRGPRSKQWHDEKLSQTVFDFSDKEMRLLRKAGAEAGLTVTGFLRKLLQEADVFSDERVDSD